MHDLTTSQVMSNYIPSDMSLRMYMYVNKRDELIQWAIAPYKIYAFFFSLLFSMQCEYGMFCCIYGSAFLCAHSSSCHHCCHHLHRCCQCPFFFSPPPPPPPPPHVLFYCLVTVWTFVCCVFLCIWFCLQRYLHIEFVTAEENESECWIILQLPLPVSLSSIDDSN